VKENSGNTYNKNTRQAVYL